MSVSSFFVPQSATSPAKAGRTGTSSAEGAILSPISADCANSKSPVAHALGDHESVVIFSNSALYKNEMTSSYSNNDGKSQFPFSKITPLQETKIVVLQASNNIKYYFVQQPEGELLVPIFVQGKVQLTPYCVEWVKFNLQVNGTQMQSFRGNYKCINDHTHYSNARFCLAQRLNRCRRILCNDVHVEYTATESESAAIQAYNSLWRTIPRVMPAAATIPAIAAPSPVPAAAEYKVDPNLVCIMLKLRDDAFIVPDHIVLKHVSDMANHHIGKLNTLMELQVVPDLIPFFHDAIEYLVWITMVADYRVKTHMRASPVLPKLPMLAHKLKLWPLPPIASLIEPHGVMHPVMHSGQNIRLPPILQPMMRAAPMPVRMMAPTPPRGSVVLRAGNISQESCYKFETVGDHVEIKFGVAGVLRTMLVCRKWLQYNIKYQDDPMRIMCSDDHGNMRSRLHPTFPCLFHLTLKDGCNNAGCTRLHLVATRVNEVPDNEREQQTEPLQLLPSAGDFMAIGGASALISATIAPIGGWAAAAAMVPQVRQSVAVPMRSSVIPLVRLAAARHVRLCKAGEACTHGSSCAFLHPHNMHLAQWDPKMPERKAFYAALKAKQVNFEELYLMMYTVLYRNIDKVEKIHEKKAHKCATNVVLDGDCVEQIKNLVVVDYKRLTLLWRSMATLARSSMVCELELEETLNGVDFALGAGPNSLEECYAMSIAALTSECVMHKFGKQSGHIAHFKTDKKAELALFSAEVMTKYGKFLEQKIRDKCLSLPWTCHHGAHTEIDGAKGSMITLNGLTGNTVVDKDEESLEKLLSVRNMLYPDFAKNHLTLLRTYTEVHADDNKDGFKKVAKKALSDCSRFASEEAKVATEIDNITAQLKENQDLLDKHASAIAKLEGNEGKMLKFLAKQYEMRLSKMNLETDLAPRIEEKEQEELAKKTMLKQKASLEKKVAGLSNAKSGQPDALREAQDELDALLGKYEYVDSYEVTHSHSKFDEAIDRLENSIEARNSWIMEKQNELERITKDIKSSLTEMLATRILQFTTSEQEEEVDEFTLRTKEDLEDALEKLDDPLEGEKYVKALSSALHFPSELLQNKMSKEELDSRLTETTRPLDKLASDLITDSKIVASNKCIAELEEKRRLAEIELDKKHALKEQALSVQRTEARLLEEKIVQQVKKDKRAIFAPAYKDLAVAEKELARNGADEDLKHKVALAKQNIATLLARELAADARYNDVIANKRDLSLSELNKPYNVVNMELSKTSSSNVRVGGAKRNYTFSWGKQTQHLSLKNRVEIFTTLVADARERGVVSVPWFNNMLEHVHALIVEARGTNALCPVKHLNYAPINMEACMERIKGIVREPVIAVSAPSFTLDQEAFTDLPTERDTLVHLAELTIKPTYRPTSASTVNTDKGRTRGQNTRFNREQDEEELLFDASTVVMMRTDDEVVSVIISPLAKVTEVAEVPVVKKPAKPFVQKPMPTLQSLKEKKQAVQDRKEAKLRREMEVKKVLIDMTEDVAEETVKTIAVLKKAMDKAMHEAGKVQGELKKAQKLEQKSPTLQTTADAAKKQAYFELMQAVAAVAKAEFELTQNVGSEVMQATLLVALGEKRHIVSEKQAEFDDLEALLVVQTDTEIVEAKQMADAFAAVEAKKRDNAHATWKAAQETTNTVVPKPLAPVTALVNELMPSVRTDKVSALMTFGTLPSAISLTEHMEMRSVRVAELDTRRGKKSKAKQDDEDDAASKTVKVLRLGPLLKPVCMAVNSRWTKMVMHSVVKQVEGEWFVQCNYTPMRAMVMEELVRVTFEELVKAGMFIEKVDEEDDFLTGFQIKQLFGVRVQVDVKPEVTKEESKKKMRAKSKETVQSMLMKDIKE
jgi:hypothetical protein